MLWTDVDSSNIASASNLLPWSVNVNFSIAPIWEDHAYIFAPVPCDTFSWTKVFAVEEFEPVIVSPTWYMPTAALDLLTTSLLFSGSNLRTTEVAFDVPPVTVSFTWYPDMSSKYR